MGGDETQLANTCYLWSDVLRESKDIRDSFDVNQVSQFEQDNCVTVGGTLGTR